LARPFGKINLIGLLFLSALAAFVYFLIFFTSPILDNLDVKEQMVAAYNQSGGLSDEAMKRWIMANTDRVGDHEEDDGYGNVKTSPGLGLTLDDISIERNTVADTITIRVDYRRKILLKPTQRVYWLAFHPQLSGAIKRH